MSYSAISIIYNPKSTGDSAKNAKKLKLQLTKSFSDLDIKLKSTKYAGHAEEIAYNLAMASKSPLIISSSGDGGYNEVVNGVVKAQSEGASPICTVLASGNANDHSRVMQKDSLLKSIKNGKIKKIDLLKISIKNSRSTTERFAHSYIGFGLTPIVAIELNKNDLNALKELSIILRTFYKYRPFKIEHKKKILKLDSMVFANIGEMAKILTISKKSKLNDGLFEIVSFEHGNKTELLKKLTKATVDGLEETKQAKSYEFRVLKNMPAQLDGEVIKIKKDSLVKITCEHKILTTLV